MSLLYSSNEAAPRSQQQRGGDRGGRGDFPLPSPHRVMTLQQQQQQMIGSHGESRTPATPAGHALGAPARQCLHHHPPPPRVKTREVGQTSQGPRSILSSRVNITAHPKLARDPSIFEGQRVAIRLTQSHQRTGCWVETKGRHSPVHCWPASTPTPPLRQRERSKQCEGGRDCCNYREGHPHRTLTMLKRGCLPRGLAANLWPTPPVV